jgi:hypothetical protein
VDPSFLDSLFAFGRQGNQLDAGLAHFRSDDKLSIQERFPPVPFLGRSGMELRHSFLLQSVEGVEGATDPWSIHRDGAYHSFDAINGRSVWITIRGKDLLQQRTMDDSVDLPVYRGMMGSDVAAAFEASLATHLISKVFYCWCQNWHWYVRGLEDHTQESLVSADRACALQQ